MFPFSYIFSSMPLKPQAWALSCFFFLFLPPNHLLAIINKFFDFSTLSSPPLFFFFLTFLLLVSVVPLNLLWASIPASECCPHFSSTFPFSSLSTSSFPAQAISTSSLVPWSLFFSPASFPKGTCAQVMSSTQALQLCKSQQKCLLSPRACLGALLLNLVVVSHKQLFQRQEGWNCVSRPMHDTHLCFLRCFHFVFGLLTLHLIPGNFSRW